MFQTLVMRPIEIWREKSVKEPIKRGTVFGTITLGMLVLLNIITLISAVMIAYSRKVRGYEHCSLSELWGIRWNAIRGTQLVRSVAKNASID